jgi:folate-binding Fe-S cluster repair protein YgfZ
VHLNKGCYRGQETIAKVHNLGHPPRRLVMLHLDGSEGVLPEAGAEVFAPPSPVVEPVETTPGLAEPPSPVEPVETIPEPAEPTRAEPRPLGRVTSSALHYELGPIALAVIKRNVDPTLDLVVVTDGPDAVHIAAAQEIIVPTDAGAEANIPRLPRLGAVSRSS